MISILTDDICFRIISLLSHYRFLRQVCAGWRDKLDNDYPDIRRRTRGAISMFELPINLVKSCFDMEEIRRQINSRGAPEMTDDAINKFCGYIKFNSLVRNQWISLDVAQKYSHHITWGFYHLTPRINPEILEWDNDDRECVNHKKILKRHMIDAKIYEGWVNECPRTLCTYQILPFDIRDSILADSAVRMADICQYQPLDEAFMRKHAETIKWSIISEHQILREDFIREFADKVDWNCITLHQQLSRPFLLEFKDKVNWVYVPKYQHVNMEKLVEEGAADVMDWTSLCRERYLSEEFIRKYSDRVHWNSVSAHDELSVEFLREFADKVDWKEIACNKNVHLTRQEKIEFLDYLMPY